MTEDSANVFFKRSGDHVEPPATRDNRLKAHKSHFLDGTPPFPKLIFLLTGSLQSYQFYAMAFLFFIFLWRVRTTDIIAANSFSGCSLSSLLLGFRFTMSMKISYVMAYISQIICGLRSRNSYNREFRFQSI